MGATFNKFTEPGISPNFDEHPSFDPLIGFPNGRIPREMKLTEQEMDLAKISRDQRDFCAHLLIPIMRCRRENAPLHYRCKHLVHEHQGCQQDT